MHDCIWCGRKPHLKGTAANRGGATTAHARPAPMLEVLALRFTAVHQRLLLVCLLLASAAAFAADGKTLFEQKRFTPSTAWRRSGCATIRMTPMP